MLDIASKIFGEKKHSVSPKHINFAEAEQSFDLLARHLPYESYDDENGLFENYETTAFALKGVPLAGSNIDSQVAIDRFFQDQDNLPEGCSLQFLLISSPKIRDQLQYWKSFRKEGVFKDLAERRVAYLESMAFDKETPIRDYQLIISYTHPCKVENKVQIQRIVQMRDAFQETLKQIGLHTAVMNRNDLVVAVSDIVNFKETTENNSYWDSEVESISNLISNGSQSLEVKPEGLKIGDQITCQSYIPQEAPREWALPYMDSFLGNIVANKHQMPCSFLLHYGFTVCGSQGSYRKKAIVMRDADERAARGQLQRWQPDTLDNMEESREIVDHLQSGERVVDACLSVTTFCNQKDKLKVAARVKSIWQEAGWSLSPAKYNHLNLLIASLPMTWTMGRSSRKAGLRKNIYGASSSLSSLGLTRKTVTSEPQNLLPVVAEWKGQQNPGIPLVGRRGQLGFWSPFGGMCIPGRELYKTSGNYNFCITGISGSGKSFLCNEIITNTISVGGRAFVMDKGESFKNLCLSLGGHHISFDFEKAFSLNPFTNLSKFKSENSDLRQDYSSFLKGLESVVMQMAFPSGEKKDHEAAFVKEAVNHVIEHYGSDGNIDLIAECLLKKNDTRASDIARSMFDFTSRGLYGQFFNPPANIDIRNDFIVIETDNLEEPLKSVMVMMMMVQVWQKMITSDRKIPYLLLIDEAWDLLRGKSSGDFIEAMALTARKYRCALGVATQSLTHFFKDGAPGPRQAWENSAWKIIFNQERDTLSGLGSHDQLSSFVENRFKYSLLSSLKPAQKFSDMVLCHQDVPMVPARLFCDPYSTLLYSTNAAEVSQLKDLQKSGLTLEESIDKVLQNRGVKQ